MRFKTDENLPRFITSRLRAHGLDVLSAAEQSLVGAPDTHLAEVCREEGRVLITLDLDFAEIRQYPPGTGPGIVVLRPRTQDRQDIAHVVELLVRTLAHDAVAGTLWIVEHSRVRVRDSGPSGAASESV